MLTPQSTWVKRIEQSRLRSEDLVSSSLFTGFVGSLSYADECVYNREVPYISEELVLMNSSKNEPKPICDVI